MKLLVAFVLGIAVGFLAAIVAWTEAERRGYDR